MFGKLIKGTFMVALVGIGAVWLLGHHRVHKAVEHAKQSVRNYVDHQVEPDEVARVRDRLRQLKEELPGRIGALQADVDEVDGQLARVEAEQELCQQVIDLVARDEARVTHEASTGSAMATAAQLEELHRTRQAYQDRLAAAKEEEAALQEQRVLLVGALERLMEEEEQLDTEIARLERDLDRIQRNQRVIQALEAAPSSAPQGLTAEDVASLKEARRLIAEMEAQQETKLERLRQDRIERQYEVRAMLQAQSLSK